MKILLLTVLSVTLCGCADMVSYSLVNPGAVPVANGTMTVAPTGSWNKEPKVQERLKFEENWTRNGFMLDQIEFVGALADGQALIKQSAKSDQQVPVFHSGMTPTDLTSMIEAYYRVRSWAKVFNTLGVKPVRFVGQNGVQFDFEYVGENSVRWRGRAVMAISGGKLYMMILNATALHYFDAARPEFEALTASAAIK
jgi:hypothetical protein